MEEDVRDTAVQKEKGGRVAKGAEAEGKNKSLEMRFPKLLEKKAGINV